MNTTAATTTGAIPATEDIFDTIQRLRGYGRPFAIATVLRTADATSAKAGAKAVITEAGEIIGHIGGGCVKGALRKAASAAIAEGAPSLIRIHPRGTDEPVVTDVAIFESGCPSRGTVDLLIEPWRRPPLVAVIGTTPIAAAIVDHARLAGLRAAETTAEALAELAPEGSDTVIIATQGAGDLPALRAALGSGAGHIPMIASARKAASLAQRLAGEGIAQASLARIKAPAGLDIGAVEPHEIALSVLAEIVVHRRRGTDENEVSAHAAAPARATG
ncbi:MAG: XdhC family protein [Pseudomonadota bacterium]